jgi:hypothetical protein
MDNYTGVDDSVYLNTSGGEHLTVRKSGVIMEHVRFDNDFRRCTFTNDDGSTLTLERIDGRWTYTGGSVSLPAEQTE